MSLLQQLDLSYCGKITDARVSASLSSLQKLDLRKCENIGDAGVSALIVVIELAAAAGFELLW